MRRPLCEAQICFLPLSRCKDSVLTIYEANIDMRVFIIPTSIKIRCIFRKLDHAICPFSSCSHDTAAKYVSALHLPLRDRSTNEGYFFYGRENTYSIACKCH